MKDLPDNLRQLPRRILDTRTCRFDDFTVTYILSESGSCYSMSVVTLGADGNVADRIFIEDLCNGIREARYLFDTVCFGEFTPCTVTDVLEDNICT